MEYIVIFNMGKEAARNGSQRIAPNAINYPIVSNYQQFHTVHCALDRFTKKEWLAGFDAVKAVM